MTAQAGNLKDEVLKDVVEAVVNILRAGLKP
jgi:hypothetical protein